MSNWQNYICEILVLSVYCETTKISVMGQPASQMMIFCSFRFFIFILPCKVMNDKIISNCTFSFGYKNPWLVSRINVLSYTSEWLFTTRNSPLEGSPAFLKCQSWKFPRSCCKYYFITMYISVNSHYMVISAKMVWYSCEKCPRLEVLTAAICAHKEPIIST